VHPHAALAVDWARPWLAPYRAVGEAAAHHIAAGASVADALDLCARGVPQAPRFVPQAALPAGTAYESFIDARGSVPTRDTLHDFFNGLVWLVHPQLKWQLHTAHARAIEQRGRGPTRGSLRDTLTLLDENGALLQAPAEIEAALARRDWHALFVTHRAAWAGARLQLVGHALLEKLAAPRTAITAHVLLVPDAGPADLPVHGQGDPGVAAHKPFLPMPVLGVPGWWPANASPGFYADTAVFRPAPQDPARPRPTQGIGLKDRPAP
jgi:hypothetical protein